MGMIWLAMALAMLGTVLCADDKDDDGDDLSSTTVILFMFLGLSTGIVITQVLSHYGEDIPYTCVVFFVGVLSSLIDKDSGTLGNSISKWSAMDAELLLFIFLPPLIFGEAMSLNWFHVKGSVSQAVLLAGPGVLIGAGIMGGFAKWLIPNWTWPLAMTFGSILSATDPIAVVALLNSASASPKLTILIVGESLLNDGTSIVLFTVFFNILNGRTYTGGQIIAYFFEATLGSIALGIGFGLLCVRWLRTANRPLKEVDTIVQIGITLSIGYLTFFTAQYFLEISGVLACVSAGVICAWLSPATILNREAMHSVWEMINWSLNTLIFLVAGLIIGNRTLADIDHMDWLYLLTFYAFLMVTRFFVIALLFPWLSTMGHKCTWQEGVFISWAGLRGALGMALGLLVEKNGPSDMTEQTSKMFFYVGGIAALTLLVNAPTSKSLLLMLGLLGGDSVEKRLVVSQVKRRLRRRMDKVVTDMQAEFQFTEEDILEVRGSCSLLQDPTLGEYNFRGSEIESVQPGLLANLFGVAVEPKTRSHSTTGAGSTNSKGNTANVLYNVIASTEDNEDEEEAQTSHNPRNHSTSPVDRSHSYPERRRRRSSMGSIIALRNIDDDEERYNRFSRLLDVANRGVRPVLIQEVLTYVRTIFLEILRVRYWDMIEGGKLPRLSKSAQTLLFTVDVGLDEVNMREGTRDWACLEAELDSRPMSKMLGFVEWNLPFCFPNTVSETMGRLEALHEKRAVYTLTSFIDAHEHAQRKIHYFISDSGEEEDRGSDSLNGQRNSTTSAQSEMAMANIAQTPEEMRVIAESKEAVAKARFRLSLMDPGTIAGIRAKQAARLILAKEAEMVKTMVGEGLLTANHAEEFLEEIGRDTAKIEKERNKMYRQHADTHAWRRSELKKQERESMRNSEWTDPFIASSPIASSLARKPKEKEKEKEAATTTTTNTAAGDGAAQGPQEGEDSAEATVTPLMGEGRK